MPGVGHSGQPPSISAFRPLCEELGASRAISYREEDFVTVVQEATNGHGVDVILGNMGASYLRRNLGALAHAVPRQGTNQFPANE
ncbi:hypothetical protein D3Y55_26035 [Mesorhizobium sp. DCY119]|nr:hypothetical protein D3Y55_26035 [Mesorhizobium sp. DCY119]